MGIYDRDWWKERYNHRTAQNEKRDADWRKPVEPKQPPVGRVNNFPKRSTPKLRPSPVGPILLWLTLFAIVFLIAKLALGHRI